MQKGMSDSKKTHRGDRYRRWREAVLKKGSGVCSQCGATTELTADHVLPSVTHPELRYDVSNGRVLCEKCRVKDMLKSWQDGIFKKNGRKAVEEVKKLLGR